MIISTFDSCRFVVLFAVDSVPPVLFGFGFVELSFSANLPKRNGIPKPAERNAAGQFWIGNKFLCNECCAGCVSMVKLLESLKIRKKIYVDS